LQQAEFAGLAMATVIMDVADAQSVFVVQVIAQRCVHTVAMRRGLAGCEQRDATIGGCRADRRRPVERIAIAVDIATEIIVVTEEAVEGRGDRGTIGRRIRGLGVAAFLPANRAAAVGLSVLEARIDRKDDTRSEREFRVDADAAGI
jgi:type IV pilus biogenesis protein CpaD/CtpE